MKKLFNRRVRSLLITVVMCLAFAGRVFAADTSIDETQTGSITIHKYDLTTALMSGVDTTAFTANGESDEDAEEALSQYAIENVQFTYLKVGDIEMAVDAESKTAQIAYSMDEDVAGILGLEEGPYSSKAINQALSGALAADNTATKNSLEKYVKESGGTAMPYTDSDGESCADELEVGLYLIVETEVPESVYMATNPFFVSIPMTNAAGTGWMYDVEVYPKNQSDEPLIDQLVSEKGVGYFASSTSAEMGDTIDLSIVTRVPLITSEATYLSEYTIKDAIPEGFAYVENDVVIAFYANKEDADAGDMDAAIAIWELDDGLFTVDYAGESKGTSDPGMTVEMTAEGLAELNENENLKQAYLTVHYKDIMESSDAVVLGDDGNETGATLTWKRTMSESSQTIEDVSEIYVFGLQILKTFDGENADSADAEKVKFVILNATDEHYIVAERSEEDDMFYVTGTTEDKDEATPFSPTADGMLYICGVEEDTYEIEETATAPGYSVLKDVISVSIIATAPEIIPETADWNGIPGTDVIFTPGSASQALVNSDPVVFEDGYVRLQVINTPDLILPTTGGAGIWVMTIAGICLAGIGIVLVLMAVKKGKQGSKA